jgi:hypothetical protein
MRGWTFPGERLEVRFISQPVPKAPPPQPPPDIAAADTAGAQELERARRAKGGRANVLTSPTGADLGGIGGADTAPTGKPKLGA